MHTARIAAGSALALALHASAGILHVPADYKNIQQAIDAAGKSGDTVLVASGTYSGPGNTDLDTLGKEVIVMSEDGAKGCVLDCSNQTGFVIHSGEKSATVIDGFTILSSVGSLIRGFSIENSGPAIKNCRVERSYLEGFRVVSGSPIITDCTVEDPFGGGLSSYKGDPTVTGCIFTGSHAGVSMTHVGGSFSGCLIEPDNGPAMTIYNATVDLFGCTLSSGDDGGIVASYTYLDMEKCTITNCAKTGLSTELDEDHIDSSTISHCRGGGARFLSTLAYMTFCDITDNSVNLQNQDVALGAGLRAETSLAELEGCTIARNVCGNDNDNNAGGGIWGRDDSEVRLTKCLIADNQTYVDAPGGNGGGVSVLGYSSINACTFRNNLAGQGGGYFGYGKAQLADCLFEGNFGYLGGGAWLATTVASRCTFRGNTADAQYGRGGGAVLSGPARVERCLFEENGAASGGGAAVVWSEADCSLDNCIFSGNAATASDGSAGGGLASYTLDDCAIVNCTFSANTADLGPDMYADDNASLTAPVNCIFTAPMKGDRVAGPLKMSFSCLWGGHQGKGNIDFLAEFEDDRFNLPIGSPCTDAGNNDAVLQNMTLDFDGHPRLHDDPNVGDTGNGNAPIVDMGAQESQRNRPPCYPDMNGDGKLDLFDFLAFVNAFNTQDKSANCVDDKTLDLFDFLCFVNAFNQGC